MTLGHFEEDFADRHLLHGVVAKWSRETPEAPAIINADTGEVITWAQFQGRVSAMALKLLDMGYRKGDFLASSLPLLTEHVLLEYACFQVGVVFVPLDLRLKGPEVIRSLGLVRPKGFAFLGNTPLADFRPLGRAAMEHCPYVQHFIQFSAPEECIDGALSAPVLLAEARQLAASGDPDILHRHREAMAAVVEEDGCLVIFTTGSTGYPKPALLSHRGITCQNMCLGYAFDMGDQGTARMLVNLPPSHVGCQTEQLMTTFFLGGTAVLLHVFDAAKSLKAIQDWNVNCFGQIPALFNLQWRLPDYDKYDLSSLKFALYGGQQVPRSFLDRLARMAKGFGTGLGLTETSGFVTYSPLDGSVDDILAGVGYDMPVYPMTIREPMTPDGNAGPEVAEGTVGHICFRGPQSFLGYVGNEEATRAALSTDGWLYTGDLGSVDGKGLHLAARAKLVIKPKGYQVFPAQVEDHFCEMRDRVASCGVVGVEHDVFSEGIVAFVEAQPGATPSIEDLERHAGGLASFMRPLHYVVLEPGTLPLNRVSKTDYVVLKERAQAEVARLRQSGGWDKEGVAQ
jgi:acyl-CoA synthetase (AMP-forming)/AMP-acid ligase II